MNTPMDDKRLREYLLGGLTPEEREQIESRMFEDDDFADSLREMEADLLDCFTSGRLDEADRARVAVLTRNPAWASKVAVSKWIAAQATSAPLRRASFGSIWAAPRTTAWWLGWAAALAAAIFAGWMARENGQLRALQAKPTASLVASISLTTGTQRDSSERTLAIPASSEVLRVEVAAESGYREYVLSVEGSGASFTVPAELRGATAVAWVPSAMLLAGHYDFLLKGQRGGAAELIGTYSVRIERN
jgi:hypothetical protein